MMKTSRIILDQAADKAWPRRNVAHIGLEIEGLAIDHSEPPSPSGER
ncbi:MULTISPECIES: hypothetical protein [unclassified Rhizobium]|nr:MULTISPECIES: hypothetical protein [unclassified Rhizobium]